ncbi:ArnT family glycosyltransferase [Synoicihabitans lomoniglobus]|uniref:Glycosyltransferase family 39 protein n=1 Tax=Synoicihabitans lomoniglobus TaxID=2909285 RepID=A0AAE9ZV58_9BACT|nr:glycosyltransferase family 39 protein [Opitutaceae bacterium LMO-M01]WED63385.1 glycosyltransferase family 39 protein [Opitutaceae bacterium LMO-M01]
MQDSPSPETARGERWVVVVLFVLLLAQAVFLWQHQGTVAGAADSSGYLNSARRLAEGKSSLPIQFIAGIDNEALPEYVEEVYAPLGYRAPRRDGTISPVYPVGLPLLLAGMATVTGWAAAPGCTIVLHALLALLLLYQLGREFGLPPGWSLLGVLMLAVSPLFVHLAVLTMSDVPALLWVTLTVVAAMRAQRHPGWAVAAGFALGVAVLVRPTNGLVLIPAMMAIGWNPPRLGLLMAGGVPAALGLVAYNLHTYAEVLVSGYYNPAGTFGLIHVGPTLVHYAIWLPVSLTPLVVGILALPWARRVSGRNKLVLGSWVGALFGFYAIYIYTREDYWFMRFLLPAFPALIVACLLVLRSLAGRSGLRKSRLVSPAAAWLSVALIVVVHGSLWGRAMRSFRTAQDERKYQVTASWAQRHLTMDTVVMAAQDSGALFYYTELQVLRPDWLNPEEFHHAAENIRKQGRPLYAVLKVFEKDRIFFRHLPGNWVKEATVGDSSIWRYEWPDEG